MEKQRRKRITVNVHAELIVEGKIYAGVIENISECGICVSASLSEFAMIIPGTRLDIKFASAGNQINLQCTVIWVLMNKTAKGLRYKMGMEIIEESCLEFKNFLKTPYL